MEDVNYYLSRISEIAPHLYISAWDPSNDTQALGPLLWMVGVLINNESIL
jgi:hypothetical protein